MHTKVHSGVYGCQPLFNLNHVFGDNRLGISVRLLFAVVNGFYTLLELYPRCLGQTS